MSTESTIRTQESANAETCSLHQHEPPHKPADTKRIRTRGDLSININGRVNLSATKTRGDHFDEHVAASFKPFSEPLAKGGVAPVILWGDLSSSYYGVPTAEIVSLRAPIKGGTDSSPRSRSFNSLSPKDTLTQSM